jgi:capsular exopolysaccharide synthesis family protein
LVRDLNDRSFRTARQIENALPAACLALIPKVTATAPASDGDRTLGDERGKQRTISREGELWKLAGCEDARFVEALRLIRLRAGLRGKSPSNNVIGLISALPGEGKSTIAAALALLLARRGQRCILVDCNLRNPQLSRMLCPQAAVGINEVATKGVPLEDAVWIDPSTGLRCLPAAAHPNLAPADIDLGSDPFRALFSALRAGYDFVVVELPPLAPISDARATAELIDAFILIVAWGETTVDVVQHALATAGSIGAKLLGAALNKVDIRQYGRYESRLRQYYDQASFGRYLTAKQHVPAKKHRPTA